MIAFLHGTVSEKGPDYVVVDVGGVGMCAELSAKSVGRLPAYGGEVRVYTHMSVREDAIKLYGFLDREELDMFRLLITVNKVGPRTALDILSALDPDDLRLAVLSDDAKLLAKCPGVGAKTAQRIILDLKDRVIVADALQSAAHPQAAAGTAASDAGREAVEALTALGFAPAQSLKAVAAVDDKDLSVEELIKEALKHL